MSVISFEFLFFAGVVLAIYYFLPGRLQNLLLLAGSLVFLERWSFAFTLVALGLTLLNFLIGQRIAQTKVQGRVWLWAGIGLNVLGIGYFKYNDFFVDDLIRFLDSVGIVLQPDGLRFLLPIGLSFYAVQAISYFLDIYNGVVEPADNPFAFAVYMLYFPKMVSGPIERARDFLPKLAEKRHLQQENFNRGLALILNGAFRKIVLADVLLTIIPDNLFKEPHEYSSPVLALWLLAYAFALYNDFAGYTKFVRGVSYGFGIELSANFHTPYFSRNFSEFWQRWHITLSNWLRDYIFTPLLRGLLRRKYKSRHALTIIAPPMATMFISALWHDVSLGMLVWGGLHGLFMVVERLRALFTRSKPPQQQAYWRQGIAMISVFGLTCLLWLPFRTDLSSAWAFFVRLFYLDNWQLLIENTSAVIDWDYHLHVVVYVVLVIGLIIDSIEGLMGEFVYLRMPKLLQAVFINLAGLLIFLVLTAQSEAPPPFIYQGF
jgi:D-alanyl-lipoteichoic acid acyltransferase DltB (MBOAT superfamily)